MYQFIVLGFGFTRKVLYFIIAVDQSFDEVLESENTQDTLGVLGSEKSVIRLV